MKIFDEILDYFERNKIIIISFTITLIILLSIIGFLYYKNINYKKSNKISLNTEIKKDIPKELEEVYYYVDIKGEVVNPGVYRMNENDRVIDVITNAGGLKETGNTRYINLAKKVVDEMIVIVYSNEEIESFNKEKIITIPCNCEQIKNDSCIENIKEKEPEVINDDNSEIKNELININTASKEELMTLNGIGEVKANSIIEYRNKKLFESIEEIKEVSGISETTYEKIKVFITIK